MGVDPALMEFEVHVTWGILSEVKAIQSQCNSSYWTLKGPAGLDLPASQKICSGQ